MQIISFSQNSEWILLALESCHMQIFNENESK